MLCFCFACSCATEKDIKDRTLNRFVKDDVYSNPLIGYSFKLPNPAVWKHINNPEFDMSFNHIEGTAQLFITGIHGLVRRDFPDGFVDWLLNRLQARDITIVSRQTINSQNDAEFQINIKCKFSILPRYNFGVDRSVVVFTQKKSETWVAAVYLAPDVSFEPHLNEIQQIVSTIQITPP